MQNEIGFA